MGARSQKKILIFLYVIIIISAIYLYFSYRCYNHIEGFESSMPEYIISDVHYINLDRSVDRNNKIIKELEKIKPIPVIRWKAVDGKDLSKEKINDVCKYPKGVHTTEKRKSGEVGCYLSHKTLIEHLGKLNVNPNAGHLILEDDIIIDDKFLDKLKKLIPHIPSDWGILYFGMGEKKLKNVKNEIGEVEFGWGCYGFMIKHSKIPEILSKINKMYAPIDNMILDNFKELCAYATVEDMIFATGAEVSSIG